MTNFEISQEIELIRSFGKSVNQISDGYIVNLDEERLMKITRPITQATLCEFENYLEALLRLAYSKQFRFSANELIDISLAAVNRTQFLTLHTIGCENIIDMGLAFVWSNHPNDPLPTENQLSLQLRNGWLDVSIYQDAVELIHEYRKQGFLGEACRIGRVNLAANKNMKSGTAILLSYAGLINDMRAPYIVGYTNHARFTHFNRVVGFKRNKGKYVALDSNRNGNLVFIYQTRDLYNKYFLDSP